MLLQHNFRLFQSTLPRGERQSRHCQSRSDKTNFNPRSHEGSDKFRKGHIRQKVNFNPRSHEGSDFL